MKEMLDFIFRIQMKKQKKLSTRNKQPLDVICVCY